MWPWARRGLFYLCCGTGCPASEVPAGLGWAEQELVLLMALEACPEGLAHSPCQVTTAHQPLVPPQPTCSFVTSSLVPLSEGAAALICLIWRLLRLEGAGTVISPGGGTFFEGFQVFDQTQFPASLLCYVLDRGLCYEEQYFI